MTITINQFIDMSKQTNTAATTAILAVAGLFAFASCSSDDEIVQSNYPSDNIVRIDAGVNNMTTRASMGIDNFDELGFTIVNANPTKGADYSYDNYQVTKGESGTWTSAKQMLWQSATQPVTVIAYAPYDENLTDVATKTDYKVSVAAEQKADTYESDFLVYKKADFLPNTELDAKGAVPIAFNHALSQLEIKVVFGTELDDAGAITSSPITSITVNNVRLTGQCDFTQDTPGVTAASDGEPNTVTPYQVPNSFVTAKKTDAGEVSNANVTYSCILIPQTLAGGVFGVTLTMNNGKTYTWTAQAGSDNTLAGGNKYTLTLTVGKDYVVAGTMKATPWDEATGYDSNLETD